MFRNTVSKMRMVFFILDPKSKNKLTRHALHIFLNPIDRTLKMENGAAMTLRVLKVVGGEPGNKDEDVGAALTMLMTEYNSGDDACSSDGEDCESEHESCGGPGGDAGEVALAVAAGLHVPPAASSEEAVAKALKGLKASTNASYCGGGGLDDFRQ